MKLLIKSNKVKTIAGIILLTAPLLFNSCAATKSKKCDCPKFGNAGKH